MIAKDRRVEDRAYLAHLREHRCHFCVVEHREQETRTEAHHAIAKKMGGGVRRDDSALPACEGCHARCHRRIFVYRTGARLGPIPKAQQLRVARSYWRTWRGLEKARRGPQEVPW